MNMLLWFAVATILPILALVSLAIRPIRFVAPWLGLATVAVGTGLAFSSSATYYSDRSIGVGIGWMFTTIYGFIGLGIVVSYVQFRPMAFVPLGAITAGVIHIASFYAFILPFAVDFPGMLPFAVPGFLLVAYGVYLWYRCGLAGSLEHRSRTLRLAVALGVVVGLGILGYLQFEGPRPHKFFARSPDMSRMAENSELVVEGVVTDKESSKYKSQKTGRTVRHTLYEMQVVHFWRGAGTQTIRFAVQDYSPVEMTVGQSYLIFSGGMVNSEVLHGYWHLVEPGQVWTDSDGRFYPYPGLPRDAPITRDFVAELLESKPYTGD